MPKPKKLKPNDLPNLHANHRARMRSRILRNGAASLEQHELLETLLYLPIARQNTNHAAHLLVERFGGADQALSRTVAELAGVQGVGTQSAQFLHDMGRVVEAYAQAKRRGRPVLTDSTFARRLAQDFFAENPDAGGVLFALDETLYLLSTTALSHCPSAQELITASARCRASNVVIALRRGEDDGDGVEPSQREETVFNTLYKVFSLLNIVFVDFLIIGSRHVRSCLERRQLSFCAVYDENSRLDEFSLHFTSGRDTVRFEDLETGDDSFSDSAIDPEEIHETVVEPLGTVGQMGGAKAHGDLDAAPFGDLLGDAEADEEPF